MMVYYWYRAHDMIDCAKVIIEEGIFVPRLRKPKQPKHIIGTAQREYVDVFPCACDDHTKYTSFPISSGPHTKQQTDVLCVCCCVCGVWLNSISSEAAARSSQQHD